MEIGQIVYSIRGRDKGRYALIVDIEGKFVYICDGVLRRLDKPKKKNTSHVKVIKENDLKLKQKIIDRELSNKEIQNILSKINLNQVVLESKEV